MSRAMVMYGLVLSAGMSLCRTASGQNCRETRFRVDIASEGQANFLGIPGAAGLQKTHIRSHIRGELVLSGITRVTVIAAFNPTEISLAENDNPTGSVSAAILKEVAHPFIVSFAPTGVVNYCRFPAGTSTFSKRVCLSLVSYLQFPSASQPVVHHTESTPNGSYSFQYRMVHKTANSTEYVKAAVDGVPIDSQKVGPVNMLKGHLSVDVDKAWVSFPVSRVEGRFEERTLWQTKEVSNSVSDVRILRTSQTALKRGTAPFQATYKGLINNPADKIFYQQPEGEIQAEIQRNELGNLTADDVLAMLKKVADEPADKQDQMPVYLKLNALLYVHPESATAFDVIFWESAPGSTVFQIVTRALGAVGNDASQAVLVDTIRVKIADNAWSTRMLATLTRLKAPNEQTEAFVKALTNDSNHSAARQMSIMVLGAIARSLEDSAPNRRTSISKELLVRLRAAKYPNEKRVFLAALGNVGSSETMHACVDCLGSSNDSLRAEAASALRFVKLPVVNDLLIHILETEPVAQGRAEAVYSLSFRPTTKAVIAALEASLGDSAREVRTAALQLLWGKRTQFPDIVAHVRKVATDDPDKSVREQAQDYLKKMATSG